MARRLLAVGLMLAMGYTFGVLTLGGCAGAPWPSNGKLPERVVDKLKECGEKGPIPLASVSYDLSFTVHVTEDENEARVDDVMLMDSTLHFHEVEACMADALYGMRTPLETLAVRRRNLSPGKAAPPEARALFGQAQVALLFEVAAFVVVGYAAYTVVVHLLVDKHRTKPRPHPAKPATAEPPAPALQAATAKPTATSVPTAIVPAMPTTLPLADQDLWRKCNQQHDTYKATGEEDFPYAKRMGPLQNLLQNNKASATERVTFCSVLDERIKLTQREHKERSKYIELDCDKFDWLNKGTTAAQRLVRHKLELDNVDAQLKNFYVLKARFCQ